jgi:anthranilate synthase component 2
MKIMVLDNYDSFTYNLVHILKELTRDYIGKYDKIVISPGPGVPDQAGITKKMIRHFAPVKSILGVCLGCQAIAEVFGGNLINLDRVYHGVETNIKILDEGDRIFREIPANFTAGRYHSWVVSEENLPSGLKITAKDDEGMIMAIAHLTYDVKGVQFHPESVLTKHGKQIMLNWLNL